MSGHPSGQTSLCRSQWGAFIKAFLISIVAVQLVFVDCVTAQTDFDRWDEMNEAASDALGRNDANRGLELALEAYEFARERFGSADSLTSISRLNAATAYADLGRVEEAIELYELDLSQTRATISKGDLYTKLDSLNLLYLDQDQPAKAIATYKEMAELLRDYPELVGSKGDLVVVLRLIGRLGIDDGQYSEAEGPLREAFDVASVYPDAVISLALLVDALEEQGKYNEAIAAIEGFRSSIEEQTPPDDHGLFLLRRLGSFYGAVGRYDTAEDTFEDIKKFGGRTSEHNLDIAVRLLTLKQEQGEVGEVTLP